MLLLLASLAVATDVGAGRDFGIGVMLGSPTGFTAKVYLGGRDNALDFALASAPWGWASGGAVYLHAVYLWHPSVLVSEPEFEMPWHVGVGGVAWSGYYGFVDRGHRGEGAIGARVPIGLDLDLREVPVGFFADVAMNAYFLPATFIDFGATIGGRYYF